MCHIQFVKSCIFSFYRSINWSQQGELIDRHVMSPQHIAILTVCKCPKALKQGHYPWNRRDKRLSPACMLERLRKVFAPLT